MMTPEQRLAGVIGQIIVENAKLGSEIEVLREQLEQERVRANNLERMLAEQVTEHGDGNS